MASRPTKAPLKILVVDDDPVLAKTLCRMFQQRGWDACAAFGATSAQRQLRACRFDVLVTDLCMPVQSGMEVAQMAARLSRPPQMWIMTATADVPLAEGAQILTGHQLLEKGWGLEVLVARIDETFESCEHHAA